MAVFLRLGWVDLADCQNEMGDVVDVELDRVKEWVHQAQAQHDQFVAVRLAVPAGHEVSGHAIAADGVVSFGEKIEPFAVEALEDSHYALVASSQRLAAGRHAETQEIGVAAGVDSSAGDFVEQFALQFLLLADGPRDQGPAPRRRGLRLLGLRR